MRFYSRRAAEKNNFKQTCRVLRQEGMSMVN